MLTETQIRDTLYSWLKEGEARRRDPSLKGAHPNTLRGMLQIYGWVKEDLRQGLAHAKPSYGAHQENILPKQKGEI